MGIYTSATNTALWTQPLSLWDGLSSLPNAAHMIGSRAAVAAQQAASKTTQHTQVCVAIIFKHLCLDWHCCLIVVGIWVFLQSIYRVSHTRAA